jgi:tRNA dimethylallyltransferase
MTRGRMRLPATSAATRRMTEAPPVVAVFGATALGKTEIAVALAERLGADVVVADSMQVYAGLAVLTNQPDEAQARRARHHLVGFVPPQDEFTVAQYAGRAHDVIDALRAAGRAVVVEGGSGLYLRAALGDLEFAAAPDAALRRDLEERWAHDRRGVLEELGALDPGTLDRVDEANPRRVIRALEAILLSGRPRADAKRDRLWQPPERYPHRLIALAPDDGREALKARIGERVDEMLSGGAVSEVDAARRAGPLSRTAGQAIGAKEICAHLDGGLALHEVAARMRARTRALARRQITWMRKLPSTALVPVAGRPPDAVAEAIVDLLQVGTW